MQEITLLSIIIPIYGVEKYIDNFLNSLLPQVNKNIECLFIDDGTKDSSIDILKEKLSTHPNTNHQIIHQKNQGVSGARNNGMKYATGSYFTFLDPDDEVESNYISEIVNHLTKYEVDILHINASFINFYGYKNDINLSINEGLKMVDDDYLLHHFSMGLWYPWLRVFHKKYLKIINFPHVKVCEDMFAITHCYDIGTKIYDVPKKLYLYYQRENSITNTLNPKDFTDSMLFGIAQYKPLSQKAHYSVVYSGCIRSVSLTLSVYDIKKYIAFYNEFNDDIKEILKFNQGLTKKEKFRLKHPFLYYLYKIQGRFFRLKFLRK